MAAPLHPPIRCAIPFAPFTLQQHLPHTPFLPGLHNQMATPIPFNPSPIGFQNPMITQMPTFPSPPPGIMIPAAPDLSPFSSAPTVIMPDHRFTPVPPHFTPVPPPFTTAPPPGFQNMASETPAILPAPPAFSGPVQQNEVNSYAKINN